MSFPSNWHLRQHLLSQNPYAGLASFGSTESSRGFPPETKTSVVAKRTFSDSQQNPTATNRPIRPSHTYLVFKAKREIDQSIPQKASRIARNFHCYTERNRGIAGELVYQLAQPRTDIEKNFLKHVMLGLNNLVFGSDPSSVAKESATKARSENLPKKFSDAVLDLVESGDIAVLTALLFDYLSKDDPTYVFPESPMLNRAIESAQTSSVEDAWLLLQDEAQMVDHLLKQRPSPNQMHCLTLLFERMVQNGTPVLTVSKSFRHLMEYLPFNPMAPRICSIEKLPYYQLAKASLSEAVRRHVAPGYSSPLIEMQDTVNRMFIWDPSHAFETEIRQGAPSGYHVLQSPDVHQFQDTLVLLNDPVVHENGIHIAFYEVHSHDERGLFRRGMKYSSFYAHMDPQKLAEGLSMIVSNPVNDPSRMRRANEVVYYGFHQDQRGAKVLSQVFVNVRRGIPYIASCFPVPYRDMNDTTPMSPPRILRRSSSRLEKGSPLKGAHASPAKKLKTVAKTHVSPVKGKVTHPRAIQNMIHGKLGRMIQRLPFTQLPCSPGSGMLLFSLPYSHIRGAQNIRDLLLGAVNQVRSPSMSDQSIRAIRQHDTPDSYADVPVILYVPISLLREIVEEVVE